MTQYSKFNVIYRLQKWLDSVPGQTFMNYAYSWGAAIVILGTLFKLTHLPGANIALFLGMGTEVFVFFISAFDRPFDKTADGKDLPTHVVDDEFEAETECGGNDSEADNGETPVAVAGSANGNVSGYGPVFVGAPLATPGVAGQTAASSAAAEGEEPTSSVPSSSETPMSATQTFLSQWVAEQQQVSPEMAEATQHYVEELNNLSDMLAKVSEQSQRLTRDSEEMENLNRTLTGISKVYEMQLKGASAQIGTIDQIDEQQRRLAKQIEHLNAIYARMIEAMTVNMRAAAPSAPTSTID